MIGYNPSHLNKNETLLEAFHRVEAYLKANPQYQVFQSSATYQEGTQEYALNTIVVPEGSSVGKGDVVLFSNVYYAVITAVSETTFSVKTATSFRGTTGATGANGTDGKDGVTPNISMNATVDNNVGVPEVEVTKGGTNENPSFTLGFHNIKGATGDKGETGLPALMYSKSVTTGPYSSFYTDLDGYNRTPQINDSCVYLSTNNDYFILGTIEQIFSDRQEASVHIVSKINIDGREGPRGPQGVNGRDGSDGISTLLYAGELSESVTTAELAQVTMPTDRLIQVYDILISTSPNSFGAMAQVTGLGQTTATVNFIGTLQSESGGTTLNRYEVTLGELAGNTQNVSLLHRIITTAKGNYTVYDYNRVHIYNVLDRGTVIDLQYYKANSQSIEAMNGTLLIEDGKFYNNFKVMVNTSGLTYSSQPSLPSTRVVYFNDTEIT